MTHFTDVTLPLDRELTASEGVISRQRPDWWAAGLALLSVRFIQGFIYWGGGSRRFIYGPSKLDAWGGHNWMANKFQTAMPGALFGTDHIISYMLTHFWLLYAGVILFSAAELIVGLMLMTGFLTRFAALASMGFSVMLMAMFGWQGATCIDEWTMAAANLAMGATLLLAGGGAYSIDNVLLRRIPALADRSWFRWAGGSLPLPQGDRNFRNLAFALFAFVVLFDVGTYNYYRGSVFTPFHGGPVSPTKHHFTINSLSITPDGAVRFHIYLDGGTPEAPAHIMKAVLLGPDRQVIEFVGHEGAHGIAERRNPERLCLQQVRGRSVWAGCRNGSQSDDHAADAHQARCDPGASDTRALGCERPKLHRDGGRRLGPATVTKVADIRGLPSLNDGEARLLEQLIEGLGRDALIGLSGYLADLARQASSTEVAAVLPDTPAPLATVLYGSQTGHAEHLAADLVARIRAAGLSVRLCAADEYPRRELKDEQLLLVIISTQGDGDPPDNAREMLDFLNGRRAPQLESLRYAVLALGDSSYPQFCDVGRQVDGKLAALGGRRMLPLAEADVDFETIATPWAAQVLEQTRVLLGRPASAVKAAELAHAVPSAPEVTRSHPFAAELLVNQRITGRRSDRDVRHMELLTDGSGLSYQPGDSLGVWIEQADPLVEEILDRLELDGDAEVEFSGETMPLHRWLKERRELTVLTRPFLAAHADRCRAAPLREALEPEHRDRLSQLLGTWQLADLLAHHPAEWTAGDSDRHAAAPRAAGVLHLLEPAPVRRRGGAPYRGARRLSPRGHGSLGRRVALPD